MHELGIKFHLREHLIKIPDAGPLPFNMMPTFTEE